MSKMRFPISWIGLVMRYVSSISYSVMINDYLFAYFNPSRGL